MSRRWIPSSAVAPFGGSGGGSGGGGGSRAALQVVDAPSYHLAGHRLKGGLCENCHDPSHCLLTVFSPYGRVHGTGTSVPRGRTHRGTDVPPDGTRCHAAARTGAAMCGVGASSSSARQPAANSAKGRNRPPRVAIAFFRQPSGCKDNVCPGWDGVAVLRLLRPHRSHRPQHRGAHSAQDRRMQH